MRRRLSTGMKPAFQLHAHLLEPEAVGDRAPPDRHQHLVGVERHIFAAHVDDDRRAAILLAPRLRLRAGHHLDAQLLELARHHLDDVRIVARQDRGQRLDDCDLRPQLGVQRADLDADVAAADDDEPLRDGVERQRPGRIDDPLAVELEARDLDRARAGRDHDVVGLNRRLAAVRGGQLDGVARGQARHARAVVAAVRLEQDLDAAGELADDLGLPALHLDHVDADVVREDADVAAVAELVVGLGRVDQRLGRDAADIQADAARLVALDHHRLLLELPQPDAGDIAARACSDHQRFDVDLLVRHDGGSYHELDGDPQRVPDPPAMVRGEQSSPAPHAKDRATSVAGRALARDELFGRRVLVHPGQRAQRREHQQPRRPRTPLRGATAASCPARPPAPTRRGRRTACRRRGHSCRSR